MISLLQISDPHFGTERPDVAQALLRLAHDTEPSVVVLSGDITQRARREQFKAARQFIDQLGVTSLVTIPGNHDIPLFNILGRAFAPFANHCREFGPHLEPVVESAQLLILAVNTTRRYRHKDGELSAAQVVRVERALKLAAPGQLRIVVLHHPIIVTQPKDEKNVVHGSVEAVRRWSAAGADLILGGHIHLPFVRALHEHFGGLARRMWAVQAGTAMSSRTRDGVPNSVNLIRYAGADSSPSCSVERWDYHVASQRFEPVTRTQLQVAR